MIRRATAPALAVFALSVPAAWAAVSPEDVWDHWQRSATAFGATLSAEGVAREGDTLVLTGVRYDTVQTPGAEAQPIAWMRLAEVGDGTVRVTVAPEQRMTIATDAPDGTRIEIGYLLGADGFEGIVAGDPDRLDHQITADAFRLELTPPADETFSEARIEFGLTSAAFSYVSDLTDPAAPSVGGEGGAQGAAFAFSGTDHEQSVILATGTQGPVRFTYAGRPAAEGSAGETRSLMPYPVESTLTVSAEAGTLEVTLTDAEQRSLVVNGRTGPTRLESSTTGTAIEYMLEAAGLTTDIAGPGLVAPYHIEMAQATSNVTVPFGAVGQPGPFRYAVALRDLDLGAALWDRIDPTRAFPREPMTVAIDLGGTMYWTADVFSNPEAAQNMDGIPFEFETLRIDALELSGAGLSLAGTGKFAFAPGAMARLGKAAPAPGGLPVSGRVDLSATGVNGFLDTLVRANLVPAQQLMGVQAMIGMFTVPAEGDDALRSVIEITPEGRVLANGVPFF